jgi:hypothetical protein
MNNPAAPQIGIVGTGVTSSRTASVLHTLGHTPRVEKRESASALFDCDVVILTHGAPHDALASVFVAQGIAVVSTSDHL